jgi:arginine utilization protein RocB
VITKTTGSINKKVIDRERKSIERASRKLLKKKGKKQRNLTELEEEVERLLMKEALVMVTQDFVDRMRTHFNVVYEEEQNEKHHQNNEEEDQEAASSNDKVNLNNFIGSICEDEFFDEQMETLVRESIDGEKETLEGLLNRILNDFKKPSISWL